MEKVKHSIIIWLNLGLLVSLCPWAMTFTSASQCCCFFPPLSYNRKTGGAGIGFSFALYWKLEEVIVGYFLSLQLGPDKTISLDGSEGEQNDLGVLEKVTSPPPFLEAGDFSQSSFWEPCGVPGGYSRTVLEPPLPPPTHPSQTPQPRLGFQDF